MQTLAAALRRKLGPNVGIALRHPAEGGDLWPEERDAVARAIPKRQREYAAGRHAARAALAEVGVTPMAIPMRPDRSPVWPSGYIGSIAHCDSCCIALAASLTDHPALGVDIEPTGQLEPDLIPVICTPEERHWLAGTANPGFAALQIFSAKEAIYKAQYPQTGAVIGFDAVTISLAGDSFTFSSPLALPPLKGTILIHDGLMISVAYA